MALGSLRGLCWGPPHQTGVGRYLSPVTPSPFHGVSGDKAMDLHSHQAQAGPSKRPFLQILPPRSLPFPIVSIGEIRQGMLGGVISFRETEGKMAWILFTWRTKTLGQFLPDTQLFGHPCCLQGAEGQLWAPEDLTPGRQLPQPASGGWGWEQWALPHFSVEITEAGSR